MILEDSHYSKSVAVLSVRHFVGEVPFTTIQIKYRVKLSCLILAIDAFFFSHVGGNFSLSVLLSLAWACEEKEEEAAASIEATSSWEALLITLLLGQSGPGPCDRRAWFRTNLPSQRCHFRGVASPLRPSIRQKDNECQWNGIGKKSEGGLCFVVDVRTNEKKKGRPSCRFFNANEALQGILRKLASNPELDDMTLLLQGSPATVNRAYRHAAHVLLAVLENWSEARICFPRSEKKAARFALPILVVPSAVIV